MTEDDRPDSRPTTTSRPAAGARGPPITPTTPLRCGRSGPLTATSADDDPAPPRRRPRRRTRRHPTRPSTCCTRPSRRPTRATACPGWYGPPARRRSRDATRRRPAAPQPGQPPPGYASPYAHSPYPQQPPRRQTPWAAIVAVTAVVGLVSGVLAALGVVAADRIDSRGSETSQVEPLGEDAAPLPSGNASVPRVADTVLPSVVQIQVRSGATGATGSGFVLDDEGRIVTNAHVVEPAGDDGTISVVLPNGSEHEAELIGRSPAYDLAVVQVVDRRPASRRGSAASGRLLVGQQVIAFGSPLGLTSTVTSGIVSALDRPVTAGGRRHVVVHQRHPDRRRHQPRQLGRPAGRPAGPGDRRQLGHRHREQRHRRRGRQHRRGFRDPDRPGTAHRRADHRDRQGGLPRHRGHHRHRRGAARRSSRRSPRTAPPRTPGCSRATCCAASTASRCATASS